MSKRADPKEVLLQRIREVRKRDPNRKCFDCSEKAPTYVCLTYNTFICMTCSGIHRQFSRKVKSITASEFTEAEVSALESGGNDVASAYWLATYRPADFPEPPASDATKIKEFMVRKYDQRRWVRAERQSEPVKPKKKAGTKKKSQKTANEPAPAEEEEEEETKAKPDLGNLKSIVGGDDDETPASSTPSSAPRKKSSGGDKDLKSRQSEPAAVPPKKTTKSSKSSKPTKSSTTLIDDLIDFNAFDEDGKPAEKSTKKSEPVVEEEEEEPWGFEAEQASASKVADWDSYVGSTPNSAHQPAPAPSPQIPAHSVPMGPTYPPQGPMFMYPPPGPMYAAPSPQSSVPTNTPSPVPSTTSRSSISAETTPSSAASPQASNAAPKGDDPFATLMTGSEGVPVHHSKEESLPKPAKANATSAPAPVSPAPTAPPTAPMGAMPPPMYYMPGQQFYGGYPPYYGMYPPPQAGGAPQGPPAAGGAPPPAGMYPMYYAPYGYYPPQPPSSQ